MHPSPVLIDIGGIDDQEEVAFTHLVDQQVVYGAAVLIAHHAVEHLADGSPRNVVGKYMLYVAFCITATDGYFAHVTHVEHAALGAHSLVLVGDIAILDRHFKSCKGRHQCAHSHVFVIETGFLVFH